jgi:hypothetical protein
MRRVWREEPFQDQVVEARVATVVIYWRLPAYDALQEQFSHDPLHAVAPISMPSQSTVTANTLRQPHDLAMPDAHYPGWLHSCLRIRCRGLPITNK